MKQPYRRVHLLLSVLSWIGATFSQTSSSGSGSPATETTVVSVSARPLPEATIPASVTVLTRDFIEDSHATNAAELLREAPFLQFSQTGGLGSLSTASIRGGKPNFTLVMIDGIPVNDITNILGGSFDLSTLAIDNLERVEIIRGPLSSIYGSDAIGGVINFISRRGAKATAIDFSGELGNFFQRQIHLGASGIHKRLEYSFGASYFGIGEQIDDDPYSLGNVAVHSSLSLSKTRLLEFVAHYANKQSAGFPSNGGGPELSILRTPMSDHASQIVLGISYKGQVRSWWLYSVDADRFSSGERNFTPAILDQVPPTFQSVPSSVSNTDFSRNRFGGTSQFTLRPHVFADIASTLRREEGETSGFLNATVPSSFHLKRTGFQVNPELLYASSALTASAGVGFDKGPGLAVETSPRLGVNYQAPQLGTRVKMSWAKGFKLPSFFALGDPNVGNPNLQPERSRSFDVGLEQKVFSRWLFSATYFRNDFTNLVDFSPQLFRLVNRSRAKTRGVEFGGDYGFNPAVRFGGYFSYINWKLENTLEPLRGVPRWNGGAHVNWTCGNRFRARLASEWTGRRYDFAVPLVNQTTVGGYSNTNLSATYLLADNMTVYLRADNLFNSRYHEFIGFPSPGITVRAGMRYTFVRRAPKQSAAGEGTNH